MILKSKLSAFVWALLVFASGGAMGAVSYRLYEVETAVPPVKASHKKSPDEFRKLIISRLNDAVHLDDAQLRQVQGVYDDEGAWFAQTHRDFDTKIQEIYKQFARERDLRHEASMTKIRMLLRPEQQPLFEKWLAERSANRKRHEDQEQQRRDRSKPALPAPSK